MEIARTHSRQTIDTDFNRGYFRGTDDLPLKKSGRFPDEFLQRSGEPLEDEPGP